MVARKKSPQDVGLQTLPVSVPVTQTFLRALLRSSTVRTTWPLPPVSSTELMEGRKTQRSWTRVCSRTSLDQVRPESSPACRWRWASGRWPSPATPTPPGWSAGSQVQSRNLRLTGGVSPATPETRPPGRPTGRVGSSEAPGGQEADTPGSGL